MSGWRNITISPGKQRKGVQNLVALLTDAFNPSVVATDEARHHPEELVDDARDSTVNELLVVGRGFVVLTLHGYNRIPSGGDAYDLLPACLEDNTTYWELASVTAANDTTDSGHTALFRARGDEPDLMEVKDGEEAQFMRDVYEYFNEEYNFRPTIRAVNADYLDYYLEFST